MIKRLIKIAVILLCFVFVPSIAVSAEEKESLEQFAETDTLWENLPEEVDADTLHDLLENEDTTSVSKRLWEGFLSIFSIGLRSGIVFFGKLCGLLLFATLFRTVKESFGLGVWESAFDFLLPLSMALLVFSSLQEPIILATTALQSIHGFFLASLPITTVLLTLSGSPSAAGTLAASINFVLATVTALSSTFLTPLFNTLFAFSAVDGILDGGLGSLLTFFKKLLKTACILFFTIVSAILSLQNALALAADSVAMRSVRFAAGTFIPVVGSLVGESTKTLAAAFKSVKTECGVLCIFVLLYVLLRPILCIAIQKLFMEFASSFAEILGEKSMQTQLKSLSGLFDLLLALLISEGCYLIFYVTLFINARGGF